MFPHNCPPHPCRFFHPPRPPFGFLRPMYPSSVQLVQDPPEQSLDLFFALLLGVVYLHFFVLVPFTKPPLIFITSCTASFCFSSLYLPYFFLPRITWNLSACSVPEKFIMPISVYTFISASFLYACLPCPGTCPMTLVHPFPRPPLLSCLI